MFAQLHRHPETLLNGFLCFEEITWRRTPRTHLSRLGNGVNPRLRAMTVAPRRTPGLVHNFYMHREVGMPQLRIYLCLNWRTQRHRGIQDKTQRDN